MIVIARKQCPYCQKWFIPRPGRTQITCGKPKCQKAHGKVWRADNAQRLRAQQQCWYMANAERISACGKAYYAANGESIRAKHAAYRKANPEKVAAANKSWRMSNPTYDARKYAKKRATENLINLLSASRLRVDLQHHATIMGVETMNASDLGAKQEEWRLKIESLDFDGCEQLYEAKQATLEESVVVLAEIAARYKRDWPSAFKKKFRHTGEMLLLVQEGKLNPALYLANPKPTLAKLAAAKVPFEQQPSLAGMRVAEPEGGSHPLDVSEATAEEIAQVIDDRGIVPEGEQATPRAGLESSVEKPLADRLGQLDELIDRCEAQIEKENQRHARAVAALREQLAELRAERKQLAKELAALALTYPLSPMRPSIVTCRRVWTSPDVCGHCGASTSTVTREGNSRSLLGRAGRIIAPARPFFFASFLGLRRRFFNGNLSSRKQGAQSRRASLQHALPDRHGGQILAGSARRSGDFLAHQKRSLSARRSHALRFCRRPRRLHRSDPRLRRSPEQRRGTGSSWWRRRGLHAAARRDKPSD